MNQFSLSASDLEPNDNGIIQFSIMPHEQYEFASSDIYSNVSDDKIGNTEISPNTVEENQIQEMLNKWDLGILYSIFKDEFIGVACIKVMNDTHITKLVEKYGIKLGTQIKLEANIKQYQLSLATKIPSSIPEIIDLAFDPNEINMVDESVPAIIDVNKILQSSVQGRSIIHMYSLNNKLNDGARNIIVEYIVRHMFQNGIRMTVGLARDISEKIVQMFPTEFMAYYYFQHHGKKPQGKVYDKYFNSQRPLKASGLMPKRSYSVKTDILDQSNNFEIELSPPETNITDQLEAIFTDNCSWAEVEQHWQATKNYRLNQILNANCTSDILVKWKQYKKPMGYKLINIDFHQLYPDASSLIIQYEAFETSYIPVLSEKVKDLKSKALLRDLLEPMKPVSKSGRSCAIFYLLHSILIPTTTTVVGENNKRIRIKYSINDSQSSFLIVGVTVADCEEQLIRKGTQKSSIQPLIMITGTVLEPIDLIIYFDGIKYIVNSFIEAVDICFKIFNVLHLEYPTASHLVWRFIQKHFYNIKTKYDKSNIHVDCLISALK